jgi:2-oxo-4-hydroxy-4-carboxy-5-ureidoimidazoline decarboxylase
LNQAYREKFGFPFLFAVTGSTKREVLNALERRLTSTRDVEHKEALRQVYRIARFRLEEALGEF